MKEQSQSLIPFLELGDSPLRENWPTPNASDAHNPNMKNDHDVKKSYLRGVVLEQLPLPKSTPMQAQCLPTDSQKSQTSAQFATLPAIHFLAEQVTAQLTLLLEVSRVNRTPPPDLEKPTKMTEIYGGNVLECFAHYDPNLDCLKMSGAYLAVQKEIFSTELCRTWPKLGMGYSGMLYRLVPLAHPTNENGYGLPSSMNWPSPRESVTINQQVERNWLTPSVVQIQRKDFAKRIAYRASIGRKYVEGSLKEQMQNWPTPTAAEGSRIANQANYGQMGLSNHPAIVGDPTRPKGTKDGKHSGLPVQDNHNSTGNHREQSWPTPRAESGVSRKPGTGGKLNPTWVECLMGYPQGWTQFPYKWKAERKIKTQPKTVPTD